MGRLRGTGVAAGDAGPGAAAVSRTASDAQVRGGARDAEADSPRCREQRPQSFLLRAGQIAEPHATPERRRRIEKARERSVDYRTRHYGKFPGFGHHRDNAHPPRFYAELTHFMGLPVLMHRNIIPALQCVEEAVRRECAQTAYQPTSLSGLRSRNTYADYEVSNHVYGIAIDIDPHKNPCCGCIGRWRRDPLCLKDAGSVWARMAMPECWVHVFERYGFHWLGHDELEDTMHFEFLGDPERVLELQRSDALPPTRGTDVPVSESSGNAR